MRVIEAGGTIWDYLEVWNGVQESQTGRVKGQAPAMWGTDLLPREKGDSSFKNPISLNLKFAISYVFCSYEKGMHLTIDVKRNLPTLRHWDQL